MDQMNTLSRPALRITQPLGTFFVFTLDAITLNRITYSQPAKAIRHLESETPERSIYSIFGAQRPEKSNRLKEIAKFIQSTDATFPNAIILAANYDEEGRLIEDDGLRWSAKQDAAGQWSLNIPTATTPTASIIDGQHRLHAFELLDPNAPNRNMELLCVVFLELPVPYHAYVFATINFNQRKVDRSLAYELFGFDVDERAAAFWPPETLAVFFARVLNTEPSSPLFQCIIPATASDGESSVTAGPNKVRVSMATVVDGILRLITKNPREDRYSIRHVDNIKLGRRCLTRNTGLPLRDLYIDANDRGIFDIVQNYFLAVQETIWKGAHPNSYLRKTIGVQALFDVLLQITKEVPINAKNYSADALAQILKPAEGLDAEGTRYQASGIGKSEIRRDISERLALPSKTEAKQ